MKIVKGKYKTKTINRGREKNIEFSVQRDKE
jgi:hypothetical protein